MIAALLLTLAGSAFLLAVLIFAQKKTVRSVIFTGLSSVIGLWALGISLLYLGIDHELFISRVVNLVAGLAPLLLWLFIGSYEANPVAAIRRNAVSLLALGFSALDFLTRKVTAGVNVSAEGVIISPGSVAAVYGAYLAVFFLYDFIYLASLLPKVNTLERQQLRLVRVGIVITTVFGLFANFLLPYLGARNTVWLGPLSSVALIATTGYAIIAKHMFDARVIIRRTIVFSALLIFVVSVYSFLAFYLTGKVSSLFPASAQGSIAFLVNVATSLGIGFSIYPLQKFLQDRTDKFLFKKEYEQQAVLKELSTKLNQVVDLDEAIEAIMQELVNAFRLHHAVTFIFQSAENNELAIKRIKHMGYAQPKKLFLDDDDFVMAYFKENRQILLVDAFTRDLEAEQALISRKRRPASVTGEFLRAHAVKKSVLKKLLRLEGAAAIPLEIESHLVGLIIMSEKKSSDSFHGEDVTLMELVAGQAISAIQKAKLWEGDQMKTEFVSIASHELLTPISAIEGYLSMILDENLGSVDDQARGYLTNVYSSAKRLSALIKDLLSVSRIESGRMKFSPQQVDVNKLISDCLAQLLFTAKDKNLTLEFTPPKKLPLAWADSDRASQVVVNLLSNAIKYTLEGSVHVSASVEKKGFVSISVKDTGLGMSKEQMEHLFQKFYRIATPETTNIQGTGLGLYITKSIVEKMGGEIKVASAAGKGSTFTFTLPVFTVEAVGTNRMPVAPNQATSPAITS